MELCTRVYSTGLTVDERVSLYDGICLHVCPWTPVCVTRVCMGLLVFSGPYVSVCTYTLRPVCSAQFCFWGVRVCLRVRPTSTGPCVGLCALVCVYASMFMCYVWASFEKSLQVPPGPSLPSLGGCQTLTNHRSGPEG